LPAIEQASRLQGRLCRRSCGFIASHVFRHSDRQRQAGEVDMCRRLADPAATMFILIDRAGLVFFEAPARSNLAVYV
jgi:hypothetical protein